MQDSQIEKLVDNLFRHESGKMVSVLATLLGLKNLQIAEDIVQDSLLKAMNTWRYNAVPDNPSAWLYRVAKNKAIDYLRREKRYKQILPAFARLSANDKKDIPEIFIENEIQDSQLRMMFAASHPAISEDSQVAFTLKTLCGLSVQEISKAFITGEETIAKRIYRAKEKFKSEKIELEMPSTIELSQRIDVVLKCIYLVFNEGYNSSNPDRLIREDLCYEAIRLCHLLSLQPLTRKPRVYALMALMCFQASRLRSRLNENGQIIVLKYQDRSKWDRQLISKGFSYLEVAAEPFEISTYHFEAAIASLHATASSFKQTDWTSIFHLYEKLYALQPNPVVAMNKAIASAYANDKKNALKDLLEIKGLSEYYLYHTTIGELYAELKEWKRAAEYYQHALSLTTSIAEKEFLQQKIQKCKLN